MALGWPLPLAAAWQPRLMLVRSESLIDRAFLQHQQSCCGWPYPIGFVRSPRTGHIEIERARCPCEGTARRGTVLQAKAQDRHPRTGADRWRRVERKIADKVCAPAPATTPIAGLLGQPSLSTFAYLPHNRSLRHLVLGCVDDMPSERDPLGADTPVAIAGGPSGNDTHEADLRGGGLSLRAYVRR